MSNREAALAMRTKILGVLLKDARLAAGKTPRECADALDLSVANYNRYERGAHPPSLPELELLAQLFGVPVAHFWGAQTLTAGAPRDPDQLPTSDIARLRDRIIGAQLRQARLAARLQTKKLAAEIGLPAGRLSAYEFGKQPIPLPELELIATRLGLTVDDLLERTGPVGEWDSTRRDFDRFRQLPADVREFVVQPLNLDYLLLARRLSEMPADKLRGIAESLLNITL